MEKYALKFAVRVPDPVDTTVAVVLAQVGQAMVMEDEPEVQLLNV
jgi:hypothetical protein